MNHNGTMNHNLKYRSTRVNIYNQFTQIHFHMNQLTLWMHVFELFIITLSFTITEINEDRNLQWHVLPTNKSQC